VIVGADTVVSLEGVSLGKPDDAQDATRLLRELRGRSHEVISSVALRDETGRILDISCRTRVEMRAYTDDEIGAYVDSGRPLDKAGGYAIQDPDFAPVRSLEGCYLNVVGLPLCALSEGLRELGWPLADERFEPPCRLCRAGQAIVEG
jgi:MAF protein